MRLTVVLRLRLRSLASVHICRLQLSLADFDLERRLGEGSYAQVRLTIY